MHKFGFVLATAGSLLIPLIYHMYLDIPFAEDYLLHKQLLLVFPIGSTYYINLSMFAFFKKMVYQKMMCTKQVLAMMDQKFQASECGYSCLPKININCTWNQQATLDMLIFFQKHHQI